MMGRKAVLAFSVNMLKNAIGYVGLFFIARFMGPSALGTLSFGFAYIGLFNFVADLGFATAHMKKVSEGRDLGVCTGTYLAIRAALTALMVAAVTASVLIHKHLLHRSFETPQHESVIYLAMLTLAVLNLANVPGVTFAARRETAKQTLPDLAGKATEAILKIVVALAGMGVVLLAGASLAGAAVSLLLYVLVFRGEPVGRPDRAMAREYFFFAMPVMVIVSANAITENLGQIILQTFWNAEEVGYFSGAGKVTMAFTFAGAAVGTLIFPALSALKRAGDVESIRRITHGAERFCVLLLVPVGVLLTLLAPQVVALLLGPQFGRAAPVLAILAWAMIAYVVSVPYSTQIIGTGRERLSAALSVVLMALNVSINLLLVPRALGGWTLPGLGAVGAAWANLLATVLMAILYRAVVYRISGTGPNWRVLRLVPAAAAMALAAYATLGAAGTGYLGAAAAAVAGLAAYAATAWVMGELTAADWNYLAGLASPQRMTDYIVKEFKPDPNGKPGGQR